jgi:HlyD family secretion protein
VDRKINSAEIKKDKRQKRVRYIVWAGIVGMLFLGLQFLLTPSISKADIRISQASLGNIEAIVNATGKVIPKKIHVIASQVSSRVAKVHKQPGERVNKGELILSLESDTIEVKVKRIQQQLALKDNQIDAMKQTFRSSQRQKENQHALLEIERDSAAIKLKRLEHLYASKIISEFDVEDAKLILKRAETQLNQIAIELESAELTHQSNLQSQKLEKNILQTELFEWQQQLKNTSIVASTSGVITTIIEQVGTAVQIGQVVSEVSDLSSYRVEASVSDYYSERLLNKQPVLIKVGGMKLKGSVERILPTTESGRIQMWVAFEQASHESLRAQLKADVYIITDQKSGVVTVDNGAFVNGAGIQDIYVIQDNQAVKREVQIGMKNRDSIEVVKGLSAGEQVIVSDMKAYNHLEKIKLKR